MVTPYYNKPTQDGLIAHFTALHDCCKLPIIIYNIPGRSVVDMLPATMGELAKLPRIIGVKDATGDLSRNRQVGLALARGRSLAQAVQGLGHVAEGVFCARTVAERASALGVEMPISCAVDALLDGRLDPRQAVAALMAREARDEI